MYTSYCNRKKISEDELKKLGLQTRKGYAAYDKGESILPGSEKQTKTPTPPLRQDRGSYGNTLMGVGTSPKQTVQSAYSRLFPNAKNKDLFESIDEKEIEKNLKSNPLNQGIFENLPYLKPGLATFYTAAFSGNYEAANAARNLAYTEDSTVNTDILNSDEWKNSSQTTNDAKKDEGGYNGWDAASDILAIASLIPGVDTIADLVSIPIDLIRGDYVSAILSAIGAIPVVGEVADTAKIAKTADKAMDAMDAAKAAGKVSDAAKTANRSSKGTKLLNEVSNLKLKNTIKEMYRPGAEIGDGGLADAIRHENNTGKLVGGKSHIQKGRERLKNLERILQRETLTLQEREIVEDLIKDLSQALGGK